MTSTNPHRLSELFIKDRTGDVADQTLYNNRGHLKTFLNWCNDQGIESIRDLGGEELLEYKFHLKQDPEKSDTTISNHFTTLRVFFQFCNTMDATGPNQDLYTKLKSLEFSKGDASRDDMLEIGEVKDLLEYRNRFEYAQTRHVVFTILWHTGCRMGALLGLDLEDYQPVKPREHRRYGIEFQ